MSAHQEVWRRIEGFPGYEVSDQGRVRSSRRQGTDGRLLRPAAHESGYLVVHLWRHNVGHKRYVHRLVAETFHGPCPAELDEVRHLNGDPSDNRPTNLCWGTRSENALDKVRHGTHHNTAKQSCSAGHPFTPENTRHYRGRRYCKPCGLVRSAAYKRSRRAAQRISSLPDGAR